MLFYLISLTVCVTVVAAGPRIFCPEELDRGRDCNTNATIRWYFDNVDQECYAFKYNGCAGNSNNYGSQRDCFYRCDLKARIADASYCPGGEPVASCTNSNDLPPPGKKRLVCPKGSFCQNGFHVGLCCSEELRDQAEKEAKANEAKCSKGKKVVQREIWREGEFRDLRGKKCEDEFCPNGSTCVQKKTAFCCE